MTPPLSIADIRERFAPVPPIAGGVLRPDCQTTLAAPIRFEGNALHTGAVIRVALHPAGADTGIIFVRSDIKDDAARCIAARFDTVCDVTLCTRISNEHGVHVSTIEHLMAALMGMGVDNLLVEIDGEEVPIRDGSSAEFVTMIAEIGLRGLDAPRRFLRILRPLRATMGDAFCELLPDSVSAFEAEIDFAAAAIGRQKFSMTLCDNGFATHLADARTFCLSEQIEKMQAQGLARGGSLDNAIVVDGARVLNEDGLRMPDEFVRHKLLDAVGDMALAGHRILGRYRGYKAGHALNNRLLQELFSSEDAFDIVPYNVAQSVIAAE